MTNKEFYWNGGDNLLAVALAATCHVVHNVIFGETCTGKNCNDCEFYTAESVEKWLNAEHEEPLLANGDGLKPGDKIMVRDNNGQKWAQAIYLFYFNEAFYCVDGVRYIAEEGNFVNWLQARLPMEGE